jgi:inward rectifier potassium channel
MTSPAPVPSKPAAPRRQRLARGETTMRLRPGAFELRKRGATRYDLRDPYHFAVGLSWPGFLLLFVVLELAINVLFAGIYLLQPGSIANARPGAFPDAFFFSLETLATVGYGAMSPATLYGHVVSAVEIICGMAFVAIMTGLTFVRFSRPRGKILFADKAVIATHNGRPTLMVRIANGRAVSLTDATARLAVLLAEHTLEGRLYRGVHDLALIRSRIPLFPLTWTLMHRIDEDSPLYGHDAHGYAADDIRVFLSVEARDPTLAAQVYAIRDYGHADIAVGMRYADAVTTDDGGHTIADLGRLSLLEDDAFSVSPSQAVAAE